MLSAMGCHQFTSTVELSVLGMDSSISVHIQVHFSLSKMIVSIEYVLDWRVLQRPITRKWFPFQYS